MIKSTDRILIDVLTKSGLLSDEVLKKFTDATKSSPESLSDYLIRLKLLSHAQILSALSSILKIETIDLKNTLLDKTVIDRVPVKFAWYYKFMPVRIENRSLVIAVATPMDVKIQDEIRVNLGLEPKIVLALESDIVESFKRYYGLAAETIDRILTKESITKFSIDLKESDGVEDLEKKSEDASVIKLVNQIILEAYQKRATDIHIEPYRNKVRFRYRIDGVLVDANLPSEIKHFLLPILSRIKIMANLSIVEKRLPQDGSAVVKTKDQTLDLRISTIPTPRGESMVIRILPTKVMMYSLEKLGIDPANVKIFRELIKKPHGIIFVTGPTGSGKTTTLYACLNEINSQERKIITIEDPVEYEMEGITQIQVNPKVNLHFATGLRSILRHDPDIIMVGEVRDLETAEIAIRTALTGHLVFSTLHTNDAASGVTRLIEMGLESYLVASSVEAFVAQRLVRVICRNCKEEVKNPMLDLKEEIVTALKINDVDKIKIYQGRGCDQCNNTGYLGRTAIHEILVINDEIRAVILAKPRADHIKEIAMRQGMITLRQDGLRKVIEGITTPAEVMNVTTKEEYFKEELSVKAPLRPKESALPKENAIETVKRRTISKEALSAKNEYDSRIYARVRDKINVRYKVFHDEIADPHILSVKEEAMEHKTVTKDISAGGLLLAAGHTIIIGTILDLKIQLEGQAGTVECLARVCRSEEDDLSNIFNVAVYYLDITSADRAKIDDFVKNKIAQGKESVV